MSRLLVYKTNRRIHSHTENVTHHPEQGKVYNVYAND